MAIEPICAGNSLSISYLYPRIDYKGHEKSIFDYKRHEQSIFGSLKLFQPSKNGAGCLHFSKSEMLSRALRNGGKVALRNGAKVGPVCALKQAAISLHTIGSGMSVLQSSLKTSVNLIAICIFVAWLQKSGQLPAETSTVLSQVILSGILSSNDASTASGFVALFMVGWSPFLWSYGFQMFSSTGGKSSHLNGGKSRSFLQMCTTWFQRIMNPPLYGILVGILIGGTPLVHIFFPVKDNVPSILRKTNGTLATIYLGSIAFLQSVWEAASLLGSASVAVQVIVLALSLAPSIPVFSSKKNNSYAGQADEYKSSKESGTTSQFVLDSQVFWVITCVRLIAMPVAGLLIVKTLHGVDILPSNPVGILTILILSAMPSAQNLIVLLQLRSSTKSLAGVVADLLLRQYALSLVSLPLWVTAYAAVIPLM